MRRWGIRKKVLVVTLVPTLLTTLILGSFFTQSWVGNIEDLLRDRGQSLSRQLASASEYGMFTGNRNLLGSLANALLEERDVRSITFYNDQGRPLLHTGPRLNVEPTQDDLQPEGMITLSAGDSSVFIMPVRLQELMLNSMFDMDSSDAPASTRKPVGWAAVEMSHIRTDRERYRALLMSLLMILGGIALNVLIALRMSRSVTDPMFELNSAVARLREGRLDTRVHTHAGPEFEQLESGLNAMAEELHRTQEEMQQNVDQATEDLRETLETIEIQNIELDLARKEALEASRIKSEFLANMSHEIRTPLNGIIGFTELLLKSPQSRQQRDHLSTIRKSSQILLTIINDILDFSKIEAGKLILDNVPMGLRDTIEDVMVMLAPAAHAKHLDLVPLIYSDVPDSVLGDPLRVKQVITNLVNNAIKFTQTGEVVLRISLEAESEESHRLTLRFAVSDTGVGLSRSQQQTLFNAFSQADASTARQHGGTGLGLVISKRLVEEMGGSIGLESDLGNGSTFWFTLPTEIAHDTSATPPRDALRGERVLYLEQQATTGLAVQHLLTDWDVGIDRAESPTDMLQKVNSAQQQGHGYAVAIVGMTRHLLPSEQYRDLFRQLEVENDCRTLLLTPTLENEETEVTDLASAHLTKPVCRDAFYNDLFFLIHGHERRDDAPAAEPVFQPAPRTPGDMAVLAVDDNDANRKLVLTLLEDAGVRAEGAGNGFDALNRLQEQTFDLVFMDVQMPGIDGPETTARLRRQEQGRRHTPVIALTAHALAEERERLLQRHFDGYLSKPVSGQQIRDTLTRFTGYQSDDEPRRRPVRPMTDTQRQLRPSSRSRDLPSMDPEESVRLAAGKTDLARELFSMLLDQVMTDRPIIEEMAREGRTDALLERVHKLHGGTRYCGVPELRQITEKLETAIKRGTDDQQTLTESLLAAMDRLQVWAEETDWEQLLCERQSGST